MTSDSEKCPGAPPFPPSIVPADDDGGDGPPASLFAGSRIATPVLLTKYARRVLLRTRMRNRRRRVFRSTRYPTAARLAVSADRIDARPNARRCRMRPARQTDHHDDAGGRKPSTQRRIHGTRVALFQ